MATKKKIHTLGGSRIEKYYNKIVGGFVLLTALLVILILYFSFAKTTIVVVAHEVTTEITLTSTVQELGGTILLTDAEGTATYTDITSTESRSGKSSGTVTIVNNYSADQPLAVTTRLLSTEGVLFRTKEFVVVPAGGSVDVPVEADQEGVSGDIGPSRFEIVALWEGLKDDIYATSSSAMTGGELNVGVVTQNDIANAKLAAQQSVLDEAQQRFTEELRSREGLPPDPFIPSAGSIVAVTSDEVSVVAGDEASSFTATQGVTVALPVLDTSALVEFIESAIADSIPEGMALQSDLTTEHIRVAFDQLHEDATNADLSIIVQAPLVITDEHEILDRDQLLNKTSAEVDAYLRSFTEVESVSVEFSPFWVTRTPRLPDNITVRIE